MALNRLFYGDNLDVLSRLDPGCVDLVYLDPPFNSNRAYNVLFNKAGYADTAQIQAFDDTWRWTQVTDGVYHDLLAGGAPSKVADALNAMRQLVGENDMLAYLVNMAPRLVELHRILKSTGSLYLHCDATASHYLKILLDAIFGPERFINELIWKRSSAHSDSKQGAQHYGRVHDTILFYSKSEHRTFNVQHSAYDQGYIDRDYRRIEPETGRRYRLSDLSGPGGSAKGNPYYEVMGVSRHWRYTREKMDQLIAEGRIVQTRPGAVPQFKRYLDEMPGVPVQTVWTDIDVINNRSKEKLGYPTQKPVALLERILSVSSNEGDVVLDPFCGCGTTIDAAIRLGRRWIGIDVTYIAVNLIQNRLRDVHGDEIDATYKTEGIPRDLPGASALFDKSPFDFERWAVSLVDGTPNEKQVGDRGIDGVIRFLTDNRGGSGRILVSVKGGKTVNPGMLRDLLGTVDTQKAEMGLLITMAEPTRGIRDAADHSGSYIWPANGHAYPKAQVITVAELLNFKRPKMPPPLPPYQEAKRRRERPDQLTIT
jgi:DNA modification methylase